MKNKKVILTALLIIAGIAAVASAVAVFIYKFEKKRKDDEELREYIECAIE